MAAAQQAQACAGLTARSAPDTARPRRCVLLGDQGVPSTPWALAFLPGGDIIVTEQSRNTLRIIRNGVLDAAPITGLPLGIESDRRDTAGVDIALHPHFAENRLIYVAYWKPKPDNPSLRTAVLVRARYDGGTSLTDVARFSHRTHGQMDPAPRASRSAAMARFT